MKQPRESVKPIFSKWIIKQLHGIKLPDPLPFHEVDLFKEHTRAMRYCSQIDPDELIRGAWADLEEKHPEQYKIFLLCIFAGLRRNEVDKLLWQSVRWNDCRIRIEAHPWFQTKSEQSQGDVPIEPELLETLRSYHELREGDFVIESGNFPRPGVIYEHYRAEKEFSMLIA